MVLGLFISDHDRSVSLANVCELGYGIAMRVNDLGLISAICRILVP